MSALPSPTSAWQWPTEVLAFAARNKVDGYLDPLLEATRQVFPTARSLQVLLELDPEIRDDWHIIFEVCVPQKDIPSYVKAQDFWTDELFRVCPAPLVCTFRLALIPVES
jgi:hypothetical protein